MEMRWLFYFPLPNNEYVLVIVSVIVFIYSCLNFVGACIDVLHFLEHYMFFSLFVMNLNMY